ncbi:MAG: TolC family outer membrane protein [Magnetococcales bacterium]|nr:TolC family outer membrane protein [Magnetococcales bacterium]MBF0420948.1 TolC family outer membrane protein [Magnetococcales bacterium]
MYKLIKRMAMTGVLILLCSPWAGLSAEDSFTAILKHTLDTNPQVYNAQQKYVAAQTLIPQALSQLLPNVSAQLSNTYSSTHSPSGSSQTDPTLASLTLSQPLYNLETLRNYRLIYPQVKAAFMDLEVVRQRIFMDYVEKAANLLQGREIITLAEDNYKLSVSHLQATQIRFGVGELTKTDVSQSLARVYTAKSGMISAKADNDSNRSLFAELTGQKVGDDFELPTVQHEMFGLSFDKLKGAIDQRPDIAAQLLRLQSAQEAIEARKAGFWPTASVTSSGTKTWNPGLGVSGPQENVSVALNLSWPLYSGGATMSRIDEAVSQRESQQALLEQARFAALRELEVALLEYGKAEAVDQSNSVRMEAAKDALMGVTEEFKVGTRTTLDILDAQNQLFSAQTEKVKGRYAHNLSKFRILKALGMLSLEKIESSLVPLPKGDKQDVINLDKLPENYLHSDQQLLKTEPNINTKNRTGSVF